MDIIIEIIVLVIFKVPGACLRWLLNGCKKPLKEFIDNGDPYLDGIMGLALMFLIVRLIMYLV